MVTGITGYLGSHVGLKLLEDGSFKVRGTVRDLTAANKIDPLRRAYGDKFDEVELVEADLKNYDSILAAVRDSTYVIHVASPIQIAEPKDPNDLIIPAV